MSTASERYVCLPGVTLPLEPVLLALDLEHRGLRLEVDGDVLAVSPRDRLTEEDRDAIRRWRWHLIEIVTLAERPRVQ